jgi:integrase
MPDSTKRQYIAALDRFEQYLNPSHLRKVTSPVVSRFLGQLRDEKAMGKKLADATVSKIARQLKAALRWAERHGLLGKAPAFDIPKRQRGAKMMKGRLITDKEFERMLAAVPKTRPTDAPAWERLLRGLWLSGLRLGEAVALTWDEGPIAVDLGGKHPRLRILGVAQKSGRDEVLPLTPDFAQWLLQTPEAERVGKVFPLLHPATGTPLPDTDTSKIVSAIGRKARVVVDKAAGKFASAHDLRRAFGTRWAKRVMPAVLKRLMRHADIATTMGYYVDMDADELSAGLWKDFGNTFGNTRPENATAADGVESVTAGQIRG